MPPRLTKEIQNPNKEKLNPLHMQRHLLLDCGSLKQWERYLLKASGYLPQVTAPIYGQRLPLTGFYTLQAGHNTLGTGHGSLWQRQQQVRMAVALG
jgi:hypothetical protein